MSHLPVGTPIVFLPVLDGWASTPEDFYCGLPVNAGDVGVVVEDHFTTIDGAVFVDFEGYGAPLIAHPRCFETVKAHALGKLLDAVEAALNCMHRSNTHVWVPRSNFADLVIAYANYKDAVTR